MQAVQLRRVTATGGSPAAKLSAQELQAVLEHVYQMRTQQAAQIPVMVGPAELPAPPTPEVLLSPPAQSAPRKSGTQVATQFAPAPGSITDESLLERRTFNDPQANDPVLASTLAEPAAANNGRDVFMAGNSAHAEFSTNNGNSWTPVDLTTRAAPTHAPILCCDHDVIFDDARRIWIHSYAFINTPSNPTRSVIRTDIYYGVTDAIFGPDCTYDLDQSTSTTDVLLDYPHLGLTDAFLFLSTNSIGSPFAGGQAAQMFRFNLNDIFHCAPSPAGSVYSWPATAVGSVGGGGGRVWVPAEGANIRPYMYWSHARNNSEDRRFVWGDNAAAPVTSFLPVATTNFTPGTSTIPEDCRGGTNNTNYWTVLNTSILGFQRRNFVADNKVGDYWMAPSDGTHPNGFVRGVVYSVAPTLGAGGTIGTPVIGSVLTQTTLSSTAFCIGFPIVTANKKGHIGFVLAIGGKKGGSGHAVEPSVGIADDFTSLANPITLTGFGFLITGTHNPADGRYGDYYTIHPQEPCEKAFVATGYAFNGGTGVANVDARFIEFYHRRYGRCHRDYTNTAPFFE
ncbi:MAG TPA: hypothetical protein VK881_16800 [bacterium]|nr:hypothetical protein [bacterium]